MTGQLADGTAYQANDPAALAWVHVTEATSFLAAWRRYGEPGISVADQNRYFAEMAQVARALGADPVPESAAAAAALIKEMRPLLLCDARTQAVARLVLSQPASSLLAEPLRAMTIHAGIDLLPGWARQMHGLRTPLPAVPLVRAGTGAVAEVLRWTFR